MRRMTLVGTSQDWLLKVHETVNMYWHICILLFHVFLLHAHNKTQQNWQQLQYQLF